MNLDGEETARRRHLRRPVRRTRSVDRLGRVHLQAPRSGPLRSGPHPHRQGRPLVAAAVGAEGAVGGRGAQAGRHRGAPGRWNRRPRSQGSRIDVVFPMLHGPYGEDGTVQGLLELANVPYVGAGVLGSAVGMDKAVMKSLFAERGLPIVPHVTAATGTSGSATRAGASARAAATSAIPLFVKPANLGSSVGISKVDDGRRRWPTRSSWRCEFDRKLVIEAGVAERPRDRVRGAGQRRPGGVAPGRGDRHPPRRLLLLRRQVPGPRRRVVADSRRPAGGQTAAGAAAERRGVPVAGALRHGARGLLPRPRRPARCS